MYYAIISEDFPNSLPMRLEARPRHLERLQQRKTEGRLLLARPHPALDSENPGDAGFTGSLVVAHFDSLAAAESWAPSDRRVHRSDLADRRAPGTTTATHRRGPFGDLLPQPDGGRRHP
jgi:uncharacterized protein YciI